MLKFLNLLFRDFYRIFIRCVIFLIAATVASSLTIYVWRDEFAVNFTAQTIYKMHAMRYCTAGIWAMLLIFAAFMTAVKAAQWYGEDVLTNRSYLNHMLPVYTCELVISKAAAGLLALFCMAAVLTYEAFLVVEHISVLNEMLAMLPDLTTSEGVFVDIPMFVKLSLYFLFMLCMLIMSTGFLSQTLGQFALRGFSRNMLILIGFFALIFVSVGVLLSILSSNGISVDLSILKDLQRLVDTAEKVLKLISNTNLGLSIAYITGASLLLTYRLNV